MQRISSGALSHSSEQSSQKHLYGAMNKDEARRLKDLEKENTELKKLVANLSLDNAIGHASGQRPQQNL